MKNSKLRRALTLAACAVMLVCLSVGATLAYLTDSKTVTNTFTVGNVEIKLDEAKLNEYDPTNNEYTATEDGVRVTENKYHIVPGIKMAKDPTVTVIKNSEDCYVRALVTVTYREEADTVIPANFFTAWVQGFNSAIWVPYEDGETVDKYVVTKGEDAEEINMISRTYELRYYQEVEQNKDADTPLTAIFTGINLPKEMTNAQIAELADLEIKIVAHAIQADGFADAAAAWAAWE